LRIAFILSSLSVSTTDELQTQLTNSSDYSPLPFSCKKQTSAIIRWAIAGDPRRLIANRRMGLEAVSKTPACAGVCLANEWRGGRDSNPRPLP
jgi:hypothetical protein